MAYTIQNNIPNTTYKVASGVVTVTAKSGYAIDGTPTIDNYDEAGLMGRVWLDLTVSADKKTASVDLAANSVSEMYKLVLKGNTIESAAYLINNTVGNTTYEVNGDTLTVRANDGYKFETAPTAECGSGLMDRRSATGVLSDGGKVATFNLLEDDSGLSFPKNTEITVSGEVVEDAAYIINNTIQNATYAVNGDTLTVTANSGYKFETAPMAECGSGLMDRREATGVLSNNNTVATFNLLEDDNGHAFPKNTAITVSGSVVEKSYLVNNTIQNTTYAVSGDTLTVTANDGYKFETAPTATSGTGLLDGRSETGVLSENNTVATFNLLSDDSGHPFSKDSEITLSGSVVEKSYTIRNTIENTTYSISGDTLTVTANEGYKFETAPTAESGTGLMDKQTATGVLSENGKVATFNLLSDDNGHPFSKDKEITINGSVVLEGYKINNTIERTTYSVSGDTLTVTANDGYKFEVAPTADNADEASPMNRREETGVLSDGGKVATFNLLSDNSGNPFQKEYTIALRGTVVADVVYSGFYGSINVYELTNDNLKAFAEQRFSKTAEDLGKYVTNLFRIFCPVGETIDAVITTGDVNTGIQAKTPKSDIVVLNFGEVTIPFHNNDLSDYNSNIQMFLPFVGFVDINTNYIGKPINLTYEVNVITGEAVVKLSTDSIIFSVYDCNVSNALIYKTSDYDIVGDAGFSSRFMYGLKPFVKVVWRQSMNEYVNNDDCVRTVIGSITGFARFTECDEISTSQMTSDEKQMIENQLKYGIYINP